MPKQINSKAYPRKAVNAYHRDVLDLINLVRQWPKDNTELQDFLDKETLSLPEPMEFTEFREKYREVRDNGIKLGLYENQIGEIKLKELAKRLHEGKGRLNYYAQILNERRRRSPIEEVEPLSLVELEQRFQHCLYKKARKHHFLELGPRFEVWRTTDECFTFYDS